MSKINQKSAEPAESTPGIKKRGVAIVFETDETIVFTEEAKETLSQIVYGVHLLNGQLSSGTVAIRQFREVAPYGSRM